MLRLFGGCVVVGVLLAACSPGFAGSITTTNLLLRYETVGTNAYTVDAVTNRVTSWNDQSGGTVENAAVPGMGPTVLQNATPSGRAAFDFVPADSNYLRTEKLTGLATQTITYFVVLKNDVVARSEAFIRAGRTATSGDTLPWGLFAQSSNIMAYGRTGAGKWVDVKKAGDTNWHVAAAVWNGTGAEVNGNAAGTLSFAMDGTSIGTGTGVTISPPDSWLAIGASLPGVAATPTNPNGYGTPKEFLDGKIAAVLVYNTALGAADVAAVTSYLNETYIVPEPGSWTLLLGACGALSIYARRKRRS